MRVFGGRRAKGGDAGRPVAPPARLLPPVPAGAPHVLVVCTANVSRSPLAAELLRHRLADHRLAAHVSSAGVASVKMGVDPLAVEAGYELGVNIAEHQPRRLTPQILNSDGADLVIGMTREHVREIVLLNEKAWTRTFALKELARRVEQKRPLINAAPERWRELLDDSRSMSDLMGDNPDDDVADPYGRSLATHRKTAAELSALMEIVVQNLLRVVVAS